MTNTFSEHINFYPFYSENNYYINSPQKLSFEKEPELNQVLSDSSMDSKDEKDLDQITKDFINLNIIDLSFLDSDPCDFQESSINIDSNNTQTDIDEFNMNRAFKPRMPNLGAMYFQVGKSLEDIEKNNCIYNSLALNNAFQNDNYNQKMPYINRYQGINNQQKDNKNEANQTCSKRNNKLKYKIDKKYYINLIDIKTGKEKRTTVRMMNIPSYFRPKDLAKKLDENFGISPQKENRVYDFICIPYRKRDNNEKLLNSGYAFINFVHPKHILKLYSLFNGKHLKLKTSGKVCIITFASKQESNLNYRNMENCNGDEFMYFSDTKNHLQLLKD